MRAQVDDLSLQRNRKLENRDTKALSLLDVLINKLGLTISGDGEMVEEEKCLLSIRFIAHIAIHSTWRSR